ncbi:MAG: hypothetical protein C0521_16500 [Xanthomonas sp.]|nr:hypothetical protein [Xanthomonas sp.]
MATLLQQETDAREHAAQSAEPGSPWSRVDGWRLGHAGARPLAFQHRDDAWQASGQGYAGHYRIRLADGAYDVEGAQLTGGYLGLRIQGEARRFRVLRHGTRLTLHDGERRVTVETVPAYRRTAADGAESGGRIAAPMPGRVVLVKAQPGDAVTAGQELLVMEAMKMELAVKAPRDGVVAEVRAAAGDFVEADSLLVTLE